MTAWAAIWAVLASHMPVSRADLIAGWDFQTTTTGGTAVAAAPATPKSYVANFGAGTMFLNGTEGSSNWFVPATGSTNTELTAFGGTTVNAGPGFSTSTTNGALAVLGGAGNAANGKSAVFKFNMTGFQDLVVTYATQRTSTGFSTHAWDYSTDGSTWSAVQTVTGAAIPTAFGTVTLPTVTALNNLPNVYLRATFTGATASSGNNRLDNFQFNAGTFVPVGTTYTWTGTGAGGTWTNGQQGSFNTAYADSATAASVFAGVGEAVTVAPAGVQTGSVTFQSNGYVFTGGNVTLGQGTVTTDAGVTASMLAVVAGTAGIVKAGTGTLLLDAANTFTGNVNVSAGTLEINSDSDLGATTNDLIVSGTLKTPVSISLDAARDVSGVGTLDIASGTTLTVNGAANMTALTLANAGTLSLQGSTRTVGILTINAPVQLQAVGPISTTGLTAPGLTTGAVTIAPALTFTGTGDRTTNVPGTGLLTLQGDVSGLGTGRIAKTGSGTLVVSGTLADGGLRVGSTGSTPVDGGSLIVAQTASLGTGALQLNFGTFSTTASGGISSAVGLSVGGRTGAAAVISGSQPITFSGQSSFFRGTGTSGELRLNVNNTTTLSGGFAATSGSGTATGITIGGAGTLILGGDGAALVDTITTADTVRLTLGPTAVLGGGVTVGGTNVLTGSGRVAGPIAGAGSVQPGASPGILTAGSINPAAGTDFVLEFAGAVPDYTAVAASTNDVVRLTGPTPFATAMTSVNTLDLFLGVTSIAGGDSFQGGFFTDTAADFAASVTGATVNYYVLGNGSGTDATLAGQGYYSFANWKTATGAEANLSLSLSTAASTANFAAGSVNGQAMVVTAVPEPSVTVFGLLAAGLLAARAVHRRRLLAAAG